MEWVPEVARDLGPAAGWIMLGLIVFKYLLGHARALQQDNLEELKDQRDEWKHRALKAEVDLALHKEEGCAIATGNMPTLSRAPEAPIGLREQDRADGGGDGGSSGADGAY